MNEEDLSSEQQTLTIEQCLELGLQHHTAGRFPEAEGMYQKILQSDPHQPDALHLLGVIAHQIGKIDVAFEFITKSLTLRPDCAEAHSNLGNVLSKLQRPEESVASYHEAITINPDYAEAHNNLGNALKEQGRLDDAVASYRKAISIDADYADAHNNLGNVHEEQGRLDDAIARYRKSIAINPNRVEVHYNLGSALVKQGRFDEAIVSFHKAIADQPDFAEAHNNLGACLFELNKLEEAGASVQAALEIKPGFAQAHKNMGDVLLELGNQDEAIAHYERAIAIEIDCVEARNGLGAAYHELGRIDEAISSYRGALEIMPENSSARVAMAIYSWLLAEWEECVHHNGMLLNVTDRPLTRNDAHFIFPFHLLLKKLTESRSKNPLKFIPAKGAPVLFAVGESHCLSPAHTTVRLRNLDFRVQPQLIFGCKAWHLGNTSKNKYKKQFERIANSLESSAKVVVMFGEIDCRLDQGILRHHKKTGIELTKAIRDLVRSYVDYVTSVFKPRGITPIFYGVPAPIDEIDIEPSKDQKLLSDVIEQFNKNLETESEKRGLHFLDVYASTLAADEQSRKHYYLESMHMHPSVLGRLTQQL